MPTVQDLMNEVKTLHHDQQARVDTIEKEMKRLGEENSKLVSQIGMNGVPAEYKEAHEKLNTRIDEILEQIEKERIEKARPHSSSTSDGQSAIERRKNSKQHQSFMKAMRRRGKVEFLAEEDKKEVLLDHFDPMKQAQYKAL